MTTPATSGAAAPQPKPGAKKRAPVKSARRRSRELAMQGLYQWLIGGADVPTIESHIAEMDGFGKADRLHFDALLQGCIRDAAELDAMLARHVDRKTTALSPVEHAILMIGAWEMRHCIEVPYRVVLNEAVELAKTFGGTDGHKYVNGVLDKAAGELRATEVAARRGATGDGGKGANGGRGEGDNADSGADTTGDGRQGDHGAAVAEPLDEAPPSA